MQDLTHFLSAIDKLSSLSTDSLGLESMLLECVFFRIEFGSVSCISPRRVCNSIS